MNRSEYDSIRIKSFVFLSHLHTLHARLSHTYATSPPVLLASAQPLQHPQRSLAHPAHSYHPRNHPRPIHPSLGQAMDQC